MLDDPTPDGRWSVAEYARAPYRTRLLVLRPQHAADCNGTVVVGWQNVSAGYESGAPTHGEIYEGYVWVGVSAQEVGLYGFPAGHGPHGVAPCPPAARARPRALRRPAPPRRPGRVRPLHPGRQRARARPRDREHDIDPLDGLPVQRLIAAGGSQSAMRLATYLNAIHPTERALRRLPPLGVGGPRTATRGGRAADGGAHCDPHRHADSGRDRQQRVREHTPREGAVRRHRVAPGVGSRGDTARQRALPPRRTRPARSHRKPAALRAGPRRRAAAALHRWIADGVPAPHQPRIEMDPGPPLRIATDEAGNARGGIRLPGTRDADRHLPGCGDGHRTPPTLRRRDTVHRRRIARPLHEPRRVRARLERPRWTRSSCQAHCAPKTPPA